MTRARIGVGIQDFAISVKTALARAGQLGFGTVEIGTARGQTTPEQLSQSGRRHLARLVASQGMSITALEADFPRGLATDAARIDRCIAQTRAVLEMARDMRVPMVVVHPGEGLSGGEGLVEALATLGEHADRTGTVLNVHIRARPSADEMATLLTLDCPALRVCMDPAAVVMNGGDPVQVVSEMADYVGLSHARDAMPGGGSGRARSAHETALGQGAVDFPSYLAALSAAGYTGPQIIRRSDPIRAAAEIERAKALLDSYLRS